MGIFIIKGLFNISGCGLIKFVIFAEGFVVGDGRVERFTSGEGGFEFCALLCGFSVAEGKSTAVKVVPPLTGLSSLVNGLVGVFDMMCAVLLKAGEM